MKPLSIGIIGLSPGNGHPYSWSAIFNGYDPIEMEKCSFPVIPRYLEKQIFPEDAINEGSVTHVWTQNRKLSQHISRTTFIKYIVEHYTDMIGEVDCILLARDDAELHFEMAKPFIEAGIPIYIDKPLALSVREGRKLLDMQKYLGQVFSCSPLRYAHEFQISYECASRIGKLKRIHATIANDWDKYSVHVIEPLLLLTPNRGNISSYKVNKQNESTSLNVEFQSGLNVIITTTGKTTAPTTIRILGDLGFRDLVFKDTFYAFKTALYEFTRGVRARDVRIQPDFMLEVIKFIEMGRNI